MRRHELECPNCTAPLADIQEETAVHCRFCGITLNLHRSLCPGCGLLDRVERPLCHACGTTIVRTCPACRQKNWAGMESCTNCGGRLDMLEIMFRSRVRDTRERLELQQTGALLIKAREAAQAEARMERFRKMEWDRLNELAQRTAEKKKLERRVLGGILLGSALFALVMALIAALWAWMGQ